MAGCFELGPAAKSSRSKKFSPVLVFASYCSGSSIVAVVQPAQPRSRNYGALIS